MGKWTIIKSAEHRAIVRAPKPEEKKHWRNIGIFERGSRNWHPRSRRQSIFQEENQPRVAVGEERRGESEGGRERVARKMTINNWYNAARPSFRRRRRAPLPLPVCAPLSLLLQRKWRKSERRSRVRRETRSVIVRRKANAIAARRPAAAPSSYRIASRPDGFWIENESATADTLLPSPGSDGGCVSSLG